MIRDTRDWPVLECFPAGSPWGGWYGNVARLFTVCLSTGTCSDQFLAHCWICGRPDRRRPQIGEGDGRKGQTWYLSDKPSQTDMIAEKGNGIDNPRGSTWTIDRLMEKEKYVKKHCASLSLTTNDNILIPATTTTADPINKMFHCLFFCGNEWVRVIACNVTPHDWQNHRQDILHLICLPTTTSQVRVISHDEWTTNTNINILFKNKYYDY